MQLLNPYLYFNGQCEEAFKFYAKVLGGEIKAMLSPRGSPMEKQTSPERLDKIMHARLVFGDKVLMASDAPPEQYQTPQGFSVTIGVDTPAEAERIYNTFAEGGTVIMAMGPTFFAERFGMLKDKFGIPWMVLCEKKAAA